MKIKLNIAPSTTEPKTITLTLADLELTEQEWAEMTEEDRKDEIYTAINGFDDLVWVVEKIEVIEP